MNNNPHNSFDADKYNLVFDIIDHPENYSSERLKEIFSDREIREIYNLLCKTISATDCCDSIDVEAEWKYFSHRHKLSFSPKRFKLGGRAASVALICFTSFAAVAVSVAVITSLTSSRQTITTPLSTNGIHVSQSRSVMDTTLTLADSLEYKFPEIIFEDNSLKDILDAICRIYSVKAKFLNDDTPELHLYYRLDPNLSLEDIILQLNTFERINITCKDSVIIIR